MRTPQRVIVALSYIQYEGMDNSNFNVERTEGNSRILYGSNEDVTLSPHLAIWSNVDEYDTVPAEDMCLHLENDEIVLIYIF